MNINNMPSEAKYKHYFDNVLYQEINKYLDSLSPFKNYYFSFDTSDINNRDALVVIESYSKDSIKKFIVLKFSYNLQNNLLLVRSVITDKFHENELNDCYTLLVNEGYTIHEDKFTYNAPFGFNNLINSVLLKFKLSH